MGFAHRAFVAAGVGFAASMIVGCGSSGGGALLSAAQANNLTAQLNRVTQALDSQNCAAAQQYLQDFQTSVENMGGVNSTLVNNLTQGVITVESLANRDCRTVTTPQKTHTKTQATTTTTATGTTTTFTNPTTSYTQPTYTQPTDTTTTSTTSSNTTGGGCVDCLPTTTSTTTSTDTTSSTTNPSGGGGLGGADTTSTAGAGTGTGF